MDIESDLFITGGGISTDCSSFLQDKTLNKRKLKDTIVKKFLMAGMIAALKMIGNLKMI